MKDFWKSKNVLVTGATGFIGSWLTETLVKNGANVKVLVNDKDPFGIDGIKHLEKNIKMVCGDIRDKELVGKLVENCEIVFHLAAITQVLYAIKNPGETIDVNVDGTFNVLEGIRKGNGDQFLVYVSTDKVYGEPKCLPIDEDHPLSAKSPYDASKVAADRLVYAYYVTYGIKETILRWSNAYGGRDANLLRAVPDFVTSILNNKPVIIRGNGKHVRDFMYVADIVNALLLAAKKQNVSCGEAFNFGTERPTSVEELASMVIQIFGSNMKPVILGKDTPGEITTQYLSFRKAEKVLGWKPTIGLQRGLELTIDWYKENLWWQEVMKRVDNFYKLNISSGHI